MTDTTAAVATTVLPATLVEVPVLPWQFGKYTEHKNVGLNGDARTLELVRGRKMVVLAKNDGNGGESLLEVWSRGDEAVWDREQGAIDKLLADAKAAGLQYRLDMTEFGHGVHVADYTEESLADTLLQEAGAAAFLNKKRSPYFAVTDDDIRAGVYRTFSNTTGAGPELIQHLLDKHPGWKVWDRTARAWVSRVA